MKTIAIIIMVAIILEALIEYVKTIIEMVELKEYKKAVTQGITIFLGVALAFVFNLQLFNNALSEFYDISIDPTIDIILTGILFSRGSNYFSDLIGKLTNKTEPFTIDDFIYSPDLPTDTLSSEDGDTIEGV